MNAVTHQIFYHQTILTPRKVASYIAIAAIVAIAVFVGIHAGSVLRGNIHSALSNGPLKISLAVAGSAALVVAANFFSKSIYDIIKLRKTNIVKELDEFKEKSVNETWPVYMEKRRDKEIILFSNLHSGPIKVNIYNNNELGKQLSDKMLESYNNYININI